MTGVFRTSRAVPLGVLCVIAALGGAAVAQKPAAGPSLAGANVRVSTHDFFPGDPFFSEVGPPADVLQPGRHGQVRTTQLRAGASGQ